VFQEHPGESAEGVALDRFDPTAPAAYADDVYSGEGLMNTRTKRKLLLVALPIALAFVVVPSAQAANLAPNPGFESCVALAAPASWIALAQTTAVCDATNPHGDSWSMKLTGSQNNMFGGGGPAESSCITSGITAGTVYDASFWFRTTDVNASALSLDVSFDSDASCMTFIGDTQVSVFLTPTLRDGQWHQQTATVTAPANAMSTSLFVNVSCFACTTGTGLSATANFDDIVFQPQVIAVRLASFTASPSGKGITLRWRTGTEADTLGFHIYRERAGKRVRLDRALIPAKGSLSGARYAFLDQRAPHGKLTYRLEKVATDGSRTWLGRARVVPR
jgi:hypothetical protein